MEIAITAIGTANPIYKRAQQDLPEFLSAALHLKSSERRLMKSVYKATGIDYRYSVLSDYCKSPGQFEFFPNDPDTPFPGTSARMKIYKDNAIKLALSAITNCFVNLADFSSGEVTHLITISCTGMYAPGLDIEIAHQLNLNSSIKRTAINFMGCYGAFNGIKIADAICKAEPNAKVLVVSVEICTVHFQKNMHLDNIISNAIFADGAAAVLIEANPQRQKYFGLTAFHCDLLPQTSEVMAWHVGDQGFDIVLSSYVPEIIKTGISAFMYNLLNQHELTLSAIDFYAIHPGGLKILQACEESLNITVEQNRYAYHVLQNYGNMSSATILFVLKALWDDVDQSDHHKNIFSCAFGPGLTLESMLLRTHVQE